MHLFTLLQKESRKRSLAKKMTEKVTEASEKVTESVLKTKKSDRTPFADLLLRHMHLCQNKGFLSECTKACY